MSVETISAGTAHADTSRQAKWLEMTGRIENQINEARVIASQIKDAADFILRLPADTPEISEKAEGPSKELESVEHRRTVDNSPLSICLNDLQSRLYGLNEELSETLKLIDI